MIAQDDPTIGAFFGDLQIMGRPFSSGKGRKVVCRCSCGVQREFLLCNVTAGNSKTCGHSRKGKDAKAWKGAGELSGKYWNAVQGRGKYEVRMTMEDAWKVYQDQLGLCALSGMKIGFQDKTASLDRIDSAGHYEIGNVQWVHKDINRMKNAFDQDYFLAMCRRITQCAKV